MGRLRNKRIIQSRIWLDPNPAPIPECDYDESYPITVFEAVKRNMDKNSSNLQDELDSIYRLIRGKQDIIDMGVAGQVMTWTGVKGQIGAIDIVKTIDSDPASRSHQNLVSEKAIGDALDYKVSLESFNNHANDMTIHISDVERIRWNAMTPNSIFQQHITNEEMHITDEERSRWNSKANQKDFDDHIYNSENPHKTTAHQVGTYSRKEIDDMFDNMRSSFFNYLNISWDERNLNATLSKYEPTNWNPNFVLDYADPLPDVADDNAIYFALKPATDYLTNETQDCIIYVKRPGLSWIETGFQNMNPGDMVIKYPDTTMYIWTQGRFMKLFSGTVNEDIDGSGVSDKVWRPMMTEEGVLMWTLETATTAPDPMVIKGQDGYTPQKGIDYVDGKDGQGVPKEGAPGDVLVKVTGDDFDTEWKSVSEILGSMIESGGVLPNGAVKWDAIQGRPEWYDETGDNSDGFITQRAATNAIEKLRNSINRILDIIEGPNGIDGIHDGLFDHVNDFNNPHRVTAGAIGAVTTAAFSDHVNNFSNPHNVSAKQIGLGNVNNTSDLDKPISNATQDALDNLMDLIKAVSKEVTESNYVINGIWNNTKSVLSLILKDRKEIEISIPITDIFKTMFYDSVNRDLVVVFPNGAEHRIDMSSLDRRYTGSTTKNVQVIIEDDSIIKASIIPGTIGEFEIEPSVHLRNSPTTTTQPISDKSSRIATTAYVGAQVIDDLISYETDRPLSANMGRILNQRKANVQDIIDILADLPELDIIDNLETHFTDKALSANMGRELYETKAPLVHTSPSGSTFGRATINLFGHARASDIDPLMDGDVFRGTDDGYYSRADHRHPTDISRAPIHWPDVGHNQYELTGKPCTVMPPDDSNDHQIANTEWVRRNAVGTVKGECYSSKSNPKKVASLRSTYCDPVVFIRQIGSAASITFSEEDRSGSTPTELDVEGTGSAIILFAGVPVTNGMLGKDHEHLFIFDGEYWRLINPVPGTGIGGPDGIVIGPSGTSPDEDEEEIIVNKQSGHNGLTIKADGREDEIGQVERVWFAVNFSPKATDVEVTLSDFTDCFSARMGDGTDIILSRPVVVECTRSTCVIQFNMDKFYPSNSPCQLIYRSNKAWINIKEI